MLTGKYIPCYLFPGSFKKENKLSAGAGSPGFPEGSAASRPEGPAEAPGLAEAVCPRQREALSGGEIGGLLRGPASPHTATRAELRSPDYRRFPFPSASSRAA